MWQEMSKVRERWREKWILFPNEAGDCEDWVLYTTVEDMVAQHKVNMSKWQLPIIGVIYYL